MARGSPYSTARWQKLRKAILRRDGYMCIVGGPKCAGYASTVHHLVPSSQAPELFWEPSNLLSSCKPCNYGDGARVAHENTRRSKQRLHEIIEEQHQQIQQLVERINQLEQPEPEPARHRAAPAIR